MAASTSAMDSTNKRKQEEIERDIISHLPKHILASILSLIPIRQAATTSILSKSWRYVWNSIPHLKIDEIVADGCNDIDKWLAAISSILMGHRDPVESCYITIPFCAHCEARLEAHFGNLVNHLEEMSIRSLSIVTHRCEFRIPRHVFFLQSLQELSLQNCEVVLPTSFRGFPCLKTLELLNVSMSSDDFARMVCFCAGLETLEVKEHKMEGNFRFHAPNLVHLKFSASRARDISLEKTPLLADACFQILYNSSFYDPTDGDTDEIDGLVNLLMKLDTVKTLALKFEDISQFLPREHMPQSLASQHQLRKLKNLHLDIAFVDSQAISLCRFLLRSCPFLEVFSLQVASQEPGPVEIDYLEDETQLEYLTQHLTIVLIQYLHPNSEFIRFIKFLLMNAHVLKRMEIKHDVQDTEVAKILIKELESFPRASPAAALLFKPLLKL